jgi:hypothetical protein
MMMWPMSSTAGAGAGGAGIAGLGLAAAFDAAGLLAPDFAGGLAADLAAGLLVAGAVDWACASGEPQVRHAHTQTAAQ